MHAATGFSKPVAVFFHVSHVQCTVYSQLVQAVFLKV